jgi:hypothetical protein
MSDTAPRLVEGKYVLLAVLAIGIAGAGGGWWYHQSLQRRPLKLWGRDAARLILQAPDVEFCQLQPAADQSQPATIFIDEKSYEVHGCRNVARRPGFLHLRHSLMNDYSFDWSDSPVRLMRCKYLLRFRDGEKTATLAVADDYEYAKLLETGATGSIRPIASGMADVLSQESSR